VFLIETRFFMPIDFRYTKELAAIETTVRTSGALGVSSKASPCRKRFAASTNLSLLAFIWTLAWRCRTFLLAVNTAGLIL